MTEETAVVEKKRTRIPTPEQEAFREACHQRNKAHRKLTKKAKGKSGAARRRKVAKRRRKDAR